MILGVFLFGVLLGSPGHADGAMGRWGDGGPGIVRLRSSVPGPRRFGPVAAPWDRTAALQTTALAQALARQPRAAGIAAVARFAPSPPRPLAPSAFRRPRAFPADTPATTKAPPPESDRWFAEDKLKHFLMSFAVTSVGYAAARTAGFGHASALAVGTGAGAAAGVWKEARDRISGGDVSARDLVWDAVGVTVGGVFSAQVR